MFNKVPFFLKLVLAAITSLLTIFENFQKLAIIDSWFLLSDFNSLVSGILGIIVHVDTSNIGKFLLLVFLYLISCLYFLIKLILSYKLIARSRKFLTYLSLEYHIFLHQSSLNL